MVPIQTVRNLTLAADRGELAQKQVLDLRLRLALAGQAIALRDSLTTVLKQRLEIRTTELRVANQIADDHYREIEALERKARQRRTWRTLERIAWLASHLLR